MVTEGSGNAIARVDAAGKVTQYRIPGSENSPGDIVAGPDGTMWFAGFELIGRLHADGRVTGWQQMSVGLPSALTTGPDGAIWYTSETVPPRIIRVDDAGAFSSFQLPAGSGGLSMAGISSGPDGALWFTQSSMGEGPPDAIGRLLPDGRYARFSLPHPRSDPQRICVGPDGALWFTEYARYGIGRITTLGDISEFPLPPGTSPAGITAGTDGALWFTTDTRVGRITTSGQITFRPVPGSKGLGGILAAPDGTLWLADGQADTVWHFTPHS
jgi:virginiamycin B lyase